MSNRPPGIRHRTITGTGDFANASVPEPVATLAGTSLRLAGIELQGTGAFRYIPAITITGESLPLPYTPLGPGYYEIAPASIDPTNTNWPVVCWYGDLGPGGR